MINACEQICRHLFDAPFIENLLPRHNRVRTSMPGELGAQESNDTFLRNMKRFPASEQSLKDGVLLRPDCNTTSDYNIFSRYCRLNIPFQKSMCNGDRRVSTDRVTVRQLF